MTRRAGIVHLGIGAFARAHLAWYTQHADGEPWGIVAFTGRSPAVAEALAAQGYRYSLITRGPDGDVAEVIDAITVAYPGSDDSVWRSAIAAPGTRIVTLTVTERGYSADSDVPARLVAGLRARRLAGGGAIVLMSLDNLTRNGDVLRNAVFAACDDDTLRSWIEREVSFPCSMVDRITPATTGADIAALGTLPHGLVSDRVPVVTEPFSEWVIEDVFAGRDRPAWETAGARFVDDVRPYEQRKLWLLNGAHSALAYLGLYRGHTTVAEAMADPVCLKVVEDLWDEAAAELPLPVAEIVAARAALAARFGNPRIRHTLVQIASDGSAKLPVRVIDVMRARASREPGARIGAGASAVLAAWWLHLTAQPELVHDTAAPGPQASVSDVVAAVAADLVSPAVVAAVEAAVDRFRAGVSGAFTPRPGGGTV